jgi:hypothetical protein
MKASAALLAGLLAGLALGALDSAQPLPTLLSQARAQEDGFEVNKPQEDEGGGKEKAPFKNADRKAVQCAAKCQDPVLQCHQRCKHSKSQDACADGCGKRLLTCIEKCGVKLDELGE